jgi:hypothetical protein
MDKPDKPLTQITFTLPSDLKIKENARRVLALRFEHPEWTQEQIGKEVGITASRVGAILNHPRVLAAMPLIARQHVSGMVPDAIKAYKELINQKENLQVREKASNKVLTEKKVFDAPVVKVEGELTLKHVSALQDIVRKAAEGTQSDVIDAEILPDGPDDAPPVA